MCNLKSDFEGATWGFLGWVWNEPDIFLVFESLKETLISQIKYQGAD